MMDSELVDVATSALRRWELADVSGDEATKSTSLAKLEEVLAPLKMKTQVPFTPVMEKSTTDDIVSDMAEKNAISITETEQLVSENIVAQVFIAKENPKRDSLVESQEAKAVVLGAIRFAASVADNDIDDSAEPRRSRSSRDFQHGAEKVWYDFVGSAETDIGKLQEERYLPAASFAQSPHLKPVLNAVSLLAKGLTVDDKLFCVNLDAALKLKDGHQTLEKVKTLVGASDAPQNKKSAAAAIIELVGQGLGGFMKRNVDGSRRTDSFPMNDRTTMESLKNLRSPLQEPRFQIFLHGGAPANLERVRTNLNINGGRSVLSLAGRRYGTHFHDVSLPLREIKASLERVAGEVETGLFSRCGPDSELIPTRHDD